MYGPRKTFSVALSGNWTIENEGVVSARSGGKIVYRFNARDVNLIMGPVHHAKPVQFRISIDGHPPGKSHGEDSDADGHGTVSEQRTYQLIRQQKPILEREFDFTFG